MSSSQSATLLRTEGKAHPFLQTNTNWEAEAQPEVQSLIHFLFDKLTKFNL